MRSKWFSALLVLSFLTVMISGHAQPTLPDLVGARQAVPVTVVYPQAVMVGNFVEVKATVGLYGEGTASWLVVRLSSDNPEILSSSAASAPPFTCDNPGPEGSGRADLCSIFLSTFPFQIVVEFDLWAKNPGDVHMSVTAELYDKFKHPFPWATMTFGQFTVTWYYTGASEQFTVSVLPLSSSATRETIQSITTSQVVQTTTSGTTGSTPHQEIWWVSAASVLAAASILLLVVYAKTRRPDKKTAKKRRRTRMVPLYDGRTKVPLP